MIYSLLRSLVSERLWTQVDQYLVDTLVGADPALDGAREASTDAGLPEIAVSSAPTTRPTRTTSQSIAEEPRLDATVLQTVGAKGYDGFLLAVVS